MGSKHNQVIVATKMAVNLKNGKNHESSYFENDLLSPYTYLLQVKGKELRIKIVLAFNHWLQVPTEKLNYILDIFNMFHICGLMIDDIQDDTKLRRGLPSAHCIYGIPQTINASLYATFLALEKTSNLCPKASKMLSENILCAIRGQGMDIYWRENFICPTEKQYRKMVSKKTSFTFVAAIRMIQLFSENKTDYSQLVLLLGTYFQIRDDYCNINQQEALEEWPGVEDKSACKESSFCEDITEGKFSLPIIHAMQTAEGEQILNILRQRTRDVNLKKYCVSLLEKTGSLQYTRDALAELDRMARAEVVRLGGNPKMEAVLHDLLSWQT